jgi:uncharacterized protein (TIGR00730 family)
MDPSDDTDYPYPSAGDDMGAAKLAPDTPQTRSPSYRLAYDDRDFLQRDLGIHSTIVVFGSTRVVDAETATRNLRGAEAEAAADPSNRALSRRVDIARRLHDKARYYDEARELGRIITAESQVGEQCEMVVITGGGPGLMEAANRGAHDARGKTIGLNIVLPREQCPNPYVTPELNFQFHYFAVRKMHFLMRARALVAFPGGYGTLDELFETLTLIQTGKIRQLPVLLFGREYWRRIIDFEAMVEEGTVDHADLDLFQYVETATEAWDAIRAWYRGESRPGSR